MSLNANNLPKIDPPRAFAGREWEAPASVVERFRPHVRAASEDEATLSIYGEIGETFDGAGVTARRVAGVLRALGERPIVVNINSPGGDMFEGLAVYNLLREHKALVTVRVVGMAASAASVIAMSGDRIEVGRAAALMVHNAWGLVLGNRHDMREAADAFETFDGMMAAVYAARSGAERDRVAAWMDGETWFPGEDAVAAGLADDLLPSDEIAEDGEQGAAASALRTIDTALARGDRLSRRERRALLSDITATPSAAPSAVTPRADKLEAALGGLLESMRG